MALGPQRAQLVLEDLFQPSFRGKLGRDSSSKRGSEPGCPQPQQGSHPDVVQQIPILIREPPAGREGFHFHGHEIANPEGE
jgi:hypothetical protein